MRKKILYKKLPFSFFVLSALMWKKRKNQKKVIENNDRSSFVSRKWQAFVGNDWRLICAKTGCSKTKNEGLDTEKRLWTRHGVFRLTLSHCHWEAFRCSPSHVWSPWSFSSWSYDVSIKDEEVASAAQSFRNKKRSLPSMKHNARAAALSLICALSL